MKTGKQASKVIERERIKPGRPRRHVWLGATGLVFLAVAIQAQDDEYEPNPCVPPPDASYAATQHAGWSNGWSIASSDHYTFTACNPPPDDNSTTDESFDSTVNTRLSMDGGATFVCVSAPAMVTVRVSHTNNAGCTNFYSTEMLQLDITNGLPAGARIRQSPTARSMGKLTMQPASDGGYLMSSFFDIWPELSLDGGNTWSLATNSAHMVLTNRSPEVFSPTNTLPPPTQVYSSPARQIVTYCTNGGGCCGGIVISNIFHRGFTSSFPPPLLHSNTVHTFSSQVDFQLSLDGGATFSQQHVPANVGVLVNHTQDIGSVQYFDTQMLQLDLQGGTLPPQMQVRVSQSTPSFGRSYIRGVAGGYMISSSFDINTELSLDSGVTWKAACCPERMALTLTNYPTTAQSFNPVGYWRFSETTQPPSSLSASNRGSLGLPGTGAYFGGTPGVRGALVGSADTAVHLNGAVGVPFNSQFGMNSPFTVEAWLQPAGTAGTFIPLSCGTFGANRSGWAISQLGNADWNFSMYNGLGSGTAVSITAGGPLSAGAWYHVAAVYSSSTASLYVNGNGTTAPLMSSFAPDSGGPLTIGARSDFSSLWTGTADEFAFFPIPLANSTILQQYQDGTNVAPPIPYDQLIQSQNPLIYLRLDEPPLPLTSNVGSLGTNNNGLFEPGLLTGLPGVPLPGFGPLNLGIGLNGSGAYVDVPGTGLNITGPITVGSWINLNPVGTNQTVIGKGDSSYRLEINVGGLPSFSDGPSNPDAVGSNRVDDGQWHFLAGVYDGLSLNSLYVDGLLAGSASAPNAVTGSPYDVWLGGAPDYGPFRLLHGQMDEVTIYSNALSPMQILQLYNSAFVPQSAGPGVANIKILSTNSPGSQIQLSWPCGTLQWAPQVTGPFSDLLNAMSPLTLSPSNQYQFFRVRK